MMNSHKTEIEINLKSETQISEARNHKGFFFDLVIYITVMFLIREVYFQEVEFIVNGLFWSFSTLIIAAWRMRARNISWKDLGLRKPENVKKTLLFSIGILIAMVLSIMFFHMIKDFLPFLTVQEVSEGDSSSKFGDLKGNWLLFFTIMPAILIESMLEELLDRGFLMNWIEKFFSWTSLATVIAVILQAAIFGFRHSNDFSERSITVGLIRLIMGIAYVKFGRNLWPLIIAHCLLNASSMIDRLL